MSSAEERAMREGAVDFLHRTMPDARIVHELNIGGCRADIGAIEPERLVLVELKSAKDTLKRLRRQVEAFTKAAHEVVVIADQRFYAEPRPWHYAPSDALRADAQWPARIWRWPAAPDRTLGEWTLEHRRTEQPHAQRFLEILWKEELLIEAAANGVSVKTRWNSTTVINAMVWQMTGAQIARAVCRRLRQRPFPEADAPR